MAGRDLEESPQSLVVPGFTVLDVLHEGGSATVYLARQDDLDRLVALKVIRRRITDPTTWRAFDREVKAVAGLSGHPHVVAIYTTGRTASGEPFIVTEYADRGSLGDVVAGQGALPLGEAVAVGVGMVDGLAAAHAVGVVHGDVKPGNVLLTSTGGVKLADFGIARLLSGVPATAGRLPYTPAHAAPEVLMGEPAREPADAYGVASTIVEALTGRPPFGTIGSNEPVTAILRTKLSTDLAPLPANVPSRLQGVLRTALTTDPQRRPRL